MQNGLVEENLQIVLDNNQYDIDTIPTESYCDFKSHEKCLFTQKQIKDRIIFFLEWCKQNIAPKLIWEHELALSKGFTVIY